MSDAERSPAALSPSVVFRRRSGWEASDMGIFLWRTNWFPLLVFMAIPAGILYAADWALMKQDWEWTEMTMSLFIWWLKPLLDRFALQVISIRFFEPQSSLRRLFQGLGKTIMTGLAGDLLWRRFSTHRSARMPLRVLERLNPADYKRRRNLLTRNGLDFGFVLTMVCLGMIAALNFGELIFLYGISNGIKGQNIGLLDFIGDNNQLVSALFYINLIIIETLYVCMGFSLYINARVETEGWDIELLFKECVKKVSRRAAPVLFLILFFGAATGRAGAETPPGETNAAPLEPAVISEEAQASLNRIFESSDFGTEKPSRQIRFKRPVKNNSINFNPNTEGLQEILGLILRFIAGAALAAALGFAAVFAYRNRSRIFPRGFPGGRGKGRAPQAPKEALRLLEQAEEFHRKGKTREAWALCFRAFIAAFTQIRFLSFPEETTEYEALALVRKNAVRADADNEAKTNTTETNAIEDNFAKFIRRWIGFAYGGRTPEAGNFEEAYASCKAFLVGRNE